MSSHAKSPCAVVITRGKNKGKRCGDVNAKCKHTTEPMICKVCNAEFHRSTSYYRHIKTHKEQKPEQKQEPEVMIGILDKLKQLEKQNSQLLGEVQELRNRPTTNLNIAVIGASDDLYQELIQHMGNRKQAMDFLTRSCVENQPLSVFKKLYLDGKSPDDYPVACRDNLHFRYLNPDRKIVDDQGGSSISRVINNQLTNTMLLAANDNIDCDELRILQDKALKLRSSNDLAVELARITTNPDHPFFN